jgi:hypothetical protein
VLGDPPVVLRELELTTGYPDLVYVFPRAPNEDTPEARFEIGLGEIRLLHHVWGYRDQTFAEIESVLRMRLDDVRDRATRLVAARLLEIVDGILAADARGFGALKIIAVEAKVKKWRDAIHQASANRWFASESYVLLPRRGFIDQAVEEAQERGVGVIVFDGKTNTEMLRPVTQELPVSVGSWLVSEWSLQSLAGLRD